LAERRKYTLLRNRNFDRVSSVSTSMHKKVEDNVGVWFDVNLLDGDNEKDPMERSYKDFIKECNGLVIPQILLPCVHITKHKYYSIVSMDWD